MSNQNKRTLFNFNIINKNENEISKIKKRLFIRSFMNIYKRDNYNNKGNRYKQISEVEYIDECLNNTISNALSKIKKKNGDKWVYCGRACEEISELFKEEINSTMYMLNVLSGSLVTIDDDSEIKFSFNCKLEALTGKWENDSQYITFEIINNNNVQPKIENKLLMGFGPSASGKTYCVKTMIKILYLNNPSFPKSFLSIDEGIYREKSYVYQKLIDLIIEKKTFNGLKNLVLSGTHLKRSTTNKAIEIRHTLFDSNIVKNIVIEYLEKRRKPISLYVPETLEGCNSNCESLYSKYIEISQDKNWIGLLIWQHKTHKDCNFPVGMQCKGCTESGKNREIYEGKIYNNSAWKKSMKNGKREMLKAPGGNYEIHNGGKSSIIDYSKSKFRISINKIEENDKIEENVLKKIVYFIGYNKRESSNKKESDNGKESHNRKEPYIIKLFKKVKLIMKS
jgi:hypothetical protein